MESNHELFDERIKRIKTAAALGRPDQVPAITFVRVSQPAIPAPSGVYADKAHACFRHLIEEVDLKGFILSSGCDMPADAKPENFKAMVSATQA